MRLVYLNADPGIPLLGHKGASVHVREMVCALAPHVTALTAVSARVRPRRRAAGEEAGRALPCEVIELAPRSENRADRLAEAFAGNELVGRTLTELHARGKLDVLYERYSLGGVAGAEVSRKWGVPWILEVNSPLVEEAERHRSLRLPSLASFLERRLFAEASRVVAVSDEVAEHVIAHGAAPDRVTVVPNGYNAELFRPPAADWDDRGARSRPFTIAFAGSLKPWHGLETLVRAFRLLHRERPDCRLLIVGDGPLRETVRARLRRGGVPESSYRLTGAVPHEQVPALLADADVAVAPYPSLERFYFSPLKVVEYGALGLPVVASRVGQIVDLFEDGESALLVDPGDPVALASSLARLRDDNELRHRLGRGARRAVADRSWDRIASRIVGLFDELVADPVVGVPREARG